MRTQARGSPAEAKDASIAIKLFPDEILEDEKEISVMASKTKSRLAEARAAKLAALSSLKP